MANHFSILALTTSCDNSMNSMKRQKDMTLKDELPRLVGAGYATGDQWRNNSRKNETELSGECTFSCLITTMIWSDRH